MIMTNAHIWVSRLLHYSAHTLTLVLNNSFALQFCLTVNSLWSLTIASFKAPSRTHQKAYPTKSFQRYFRETPLLTLRLRKLRMLSPAVRPLTRLPRKVLFTPTGCLFPPLSGWFWSVQPEVVERNGCVCVCRKHWERRSLIRCLW